MPGLQSAGPLLLCTCLLGQPQALPAQVNAKALQAFDKFVHQREQEQAARVSGAKKFLWADESPERIRLLHEGQIVVEPETADGIIKAPNALIHNWIGAVFIPGATLDETIAVVHDYGRYKDFYKPDIITSQVVSHTGNSYQTRMRWLKKKIVTLAFEADYDVQYVPIDATRAHSSAVSTRISELEDMGTPSERALPVERGMIWRLNSYSRFEERDGGVYVECEGISLSRPFPTGLGWLIEPIVRNGARATLAHLLSSTRDAVLNYDRDLQRTRLAEGAGGGGAAK
ncbi:MAG: hypothetical protein M1541_04020 [Acidobacteria bacterium]|nr:hypothetical protein [Acidobacteriota bacterium]